MSVYEFILKKLEERDKTIYWLITHADLSMSTLYRLREKTSYSISLVTAIKIANVLDFDLNEFRVTYGNKRLDS